MKKKYTNELINEKSPYLQQHAHNPVNWYPWGKKAFEKAKKENKPIFLSIGYSTCHWCHVMEHESFEDEEVAKLLNKDFISIKVDREEHPDIDSIYMEVCQMMTRSGGWPLTIIMTPEMKPFFASTYIPKYSKYGRPGMMQLLPQVAKVWQEKPSDISKTAESVLENLKKNTSFNIKGLDVAKLANNAFHDCERNFDDEKGGFGNAPKFPTPHKLVFLTRYAKANGNSFALEMVDKTLDQMRQGGIYDQIGFGFHRYSVDRNWLVPHFEKMLYDQALLVLAYTEQYQATGNYIHRHTAENVLEYVKRDMTSPDGAFYSAEDADSDGKEGKFYVWKYAELKEVLLPPELEFMMEHFGVTEVGNFHDEATGLHTGSNIFHLQEYLSPEEEALFTDIRSKLFDIREKRIHPLKDTKILTDWNGLMIEAFAKAGKAFGSEEYITIAEQATDFILKNMLNKENHLMHRYKDGDIKSDGKIDDYAFFISGLLELYEATYKLEYLETATELSNVLTKHFRDTENGAFFMTADFSKKLIIRPKNVYDGAMPSGNSQSLLNFNRLAKLTGNSEFEKVATEIEDTYSGLATRALSGFTQFINGVQLAETESTEIVVVVDKIDNQAKAVLSAINNNYDPFKAVLVKTSQNANRLAEIAPFTKEQNLIDGKPTVYICKGFACQQPLTDLKKIEIELSK